MSLHSNLNSLLTNGSHSHEEPAYCGLLGQVATARTLLRSGSVLRSLHCIESETLARALGLFACNHFILCTPDIWHARSQAIRESRLLTPPVSIGPTSNKIMHRASESLRLLDPYCVRSSETTNRTAIYDLVAVLSQRVILCSGTASPAFYLPRAATVTYCRE